MTQLRTGPREAWQVRSGSIGGDSVQPIRERVERSDSKVSSLAMLVPCARGTVLRVTAAGELRRRLLDLGVLPGQCVSVEAFAPLDGPIEITGGSWTVR